MDRLACPYLDCEVEWTDERESHIRVRHPDLLPRFREHVVKTVADPDEVRLSTRAANARLFTRWFGDLMAGKYVVVVVVTDTGPSATPWVLSAYLAARLAKGEILEWKRD